MRSDQLSTRHDPQARRGVWPMVRALVLIVVIWAAAAAATLFVAAFTSIGPVLVSLSMNHGIHRADVLAGVLFAGFATVLSVIVVRGTRD